MKTTDQLHQIENGAGTNCHTHAFTKAHVPIKFIPFVSKRILEDPKKYDRMEWILKNINPFTPKDLVHRYGNFLTTLDKTVEQVYLEGASEWPTGTKTTILTVDMEQMGRGRVTTSYIDQVKEHIALAKKYKNVRLFVMVDPRSTSLHQLYSLIQREHRYIYGIKLYPPMGYYPTDQGLEGFWKLAEKFGWSVISHCTAKSPVFYSGKGINGMLDKKDPFYEKSLGRKGKCSNFAHPTHLEELAIRHPNLKVCAAHAGGSQEWLDYCVGAIERNDNFWMDLSYTYDTEEEQQYFAELCADKPKVAKRTNLGSDYFMTKTLTTGNPFYATMLHNLGTDLFFKVFVTNPKNFLRRTVSKK